MTIKYILLYILRRNLIKVTLYRELNTIFSLVMQIIMLIVRSTIAIY